MASVWLRQRSLLLSKPLVYNLLAPIRSNSRFLSLSLPKITSAKAAHPGRTERIRPAPGLLRRRRAKHSSMDITLSIAAFVLSILGIIGCIVPALPGVVLSYAGLLCAWFTSYSHMTSGAIWLWLAVTVAVSVADYFLPAWMTRRFGGSRSGAIGATVGVFAGFFLFPPVGIILGPFVGAVLGELLNDRGNVPKAFLVGFGSFLAFVVGTGVKLAASVGMLIHVTADTYPALRDWFVTTF